MIHLQKNRWILYLMLCGLLSHCAMSPRRVLRRPVESFPVSKKNTTLFQWPLDQIVVTSGYGKRGKQFHDGLDLRAAEGTPVRAARQGEVVYAGTRLRGYGRLIVLKHDQHFATVYAHNSKLWVRRGQHVRQGQVIALSGKTGRCTGPHLHFEIRRGLVSLDPFVHLPQVPSVPSAPSVASSRQRNSVKKAAGLRKNTRSRS